MPPTQTEVISPFRRALNQLPFLPRALGMVHRAVGSRVWLWWGLLLSQGLLPLAPVLATKAVVDALVRGSGERQVLWLVGLLGMAMIVGQGLQSLTQWLRTLQAERVQDHVMGLIQTQAQRLDLGFLETPEYYDQLHRARVDALTRPVQLLENLGALAQHTLTLMAMALLLLRFSGWFPLLLVGSMLPAFWVVAGNALRQHTWKKQATPLERKTRYLDWILTQREAAMELRLFNLGGHYQTAFQTLRARLRDEQAKLAGKEAQGEFLAGALAVVGIIFGLTWMISRTLAGQATLGDLALFAQVFFQGQRLLHTLLGRAGEIYRNLLFLENLFEFLDLQPRLTDPPPPHPVLPATAPAVVFEDLSFRYPGSDHLALAGFSLTLPAGSIHAIVGDNGSGKSTLVKLLCRFYDPDQGRVRVAGHDLRALAQQELRSHLTVLFQEPVRYHATAAENLAQSDLTALAEPDRLHAAAQAAGAAEPIERLPQGYATQLGRWFGGSELSGGEWQRVALARAFLNPAPLLVLDEPTSAMDSWAEADWLDRFRGLAAGRTVLLITHRFTTAMQADRIHVLAQGRILEAGSHAELLALEGRYAQSWRHQMKQAH